MPLWNIIKKIIERKEKHLNDTALGFVWSTHKVVKRADSLKQWFYYEKTSTYFKNVLTILIYNNSEKALELKCADNLWGTIHEVHNEIERSLQIDLNLCTFLFT